jgi:hypothetical protein
MPASNMSELVTPNSRMLSPDPKLLDKLSHDDTSPVELVPPLEEDVVIQDIFDAVEDGSLKALEPINDAGVANLLDDSVFASSDGEEEPESGKPNVNFLNLNDSKCSDLEQDMFNEFETLKLTERVHESI